MTVEQILLVVVWGLAHSLSQDLLRALDAGVVALRDFARGLDEEAALFRKLVAAADTHDDELRFVEDALCRVAWFIECGDTQAALHECERAYDEITGGLLLPCQPVTQQERIAA